MITHLPFLGKESLQHSKYNFSNQIIPLLIFSMVVEQNQRRFMTIAVNSRVAYSRVAKTCVSRALTTSDLSFSRSKRSWKYSNLKIFPQIMRPQSNIVLKYIWSFKRGWEMIYVPQNGEDVSWTINTFQLKMKRRQHMSDFLKQYFASWIYACRCLKAG